MRKTLTEGEQEALQRIATEAEQRTGKLDLSYLGLTALPSELSALTHLVLLNVNDWDSLGNPKINRIADLSPLQQLVNLQTLLIYKQPVVDIDPLRSLLALQSLTIAGAPVQYLGPLAALDNLTELDCSLCRAIDWASLPALASLRRLAAAGCQLTDARRLAALTQLEHLNILGTKVEKLQPLASLVNLRHLSCSMTPAQDWQSLKPMFQAQTLEGLYAWHVIWPGLPLEVLSADTFTDNCLPRLRAHLADLHAGATVHRQTKLMVLGNGRVGKSQLVRGLRREAFDENLPSTHGVVVTSATLPAKGNDQPADTLHVWDFGGQDLYHGTHSLFMKSGSAALVAWTPGADAAGTHVHQGMRFRNEPLAYWLEFVKGAAGGAAPLLVVQTQCDQASDEVLNPPAPQALLGSFKHKKLLHTSARNNRGFGALTEALQDAVDALVAQQGEVTIGVGRARLIAHLAALRDEDAARPEADRQHRTLSQDQFLELCAQLGDISSPAMALDYLHRCGWVFYRDDMFNQAIVLDQAWALENIYAVFHRAHSYHHIRALRGRFTLGLLQDTVWRGKSPTECRVLLDMMRSCEVCFEVRAADKAEGIEAEYIAPELLPDATLLADSLDAERAKMPADAARAELRWNFAFLHSGHVRAALSRVGPCAGEQAWYWRQGFLGYEVRHKAWLELDVQRDAAGHGGCVRFVAMGGQVGDLLAVVRRAMPAEWGDPVGVEPGRADDPRRAALADRAMGGAGGMDVAVAPVLASALAPAPASALASSLAFAPSPRTDNRPRVAISYAWGDKTDAGRARDALVDRLCDQAHTRYAIRVWRDADVMKQGERISRFMRELAAHDRIVVVLSAKFLKSEYCMFELSEIWRQVRRDGDAFLARITVWALPDAPIHSILGRLSIAVHWRDAFAELDKVVRQHGPALLGDADMVKYKQMERYAAEVGDMLALIADTLLPRNEDTDFEPFLQRTFGV